MFGYITINREELKIREYEEYRSFYCGLCHELNMRYGRTAQLMLNYDMTFLALLLDALYEPQAAKEKRRCLPHPALPHMEAVSPAISYAADMTVLLSYQNAMDDWKDDRSVPARTLALKLYPFYKELRCRYPRQAKALEKNIAALSLAEKEKCRDIDRVSGCTGAFLAQIFDWKEDIWSEDLRQVGFYLGKFVYLMDAFDDLKKDEKKGDYNLFLESGGEDGRDRTEFIRQILMDMASCGARAFERLPIVKNAEILRNILYSGIWVRYMQILDSGQERTTQKS